MIISKEILFSKQKKNYKEISFFKRNYVFLVEC